MTFRISASLSALLLAVACAKPNEAAPPTTTTAPAEGVPATSTPPAAPASSAPPPAAESTASSAPSCKPGEVRAYKYDDANTPVCGTACKSGADCSADKECGLEAARTLEPAMGMSAAKANAIMLCSPKPTVGSCAADEVFGYVDASNGRGFCAKKCTATSDCGKGHVCVEARATKEKPASKPAADATKIHMCLAPPPKK